MAGDDAPGLRHWLDIPTPGLLQHKWADGTTVSYRDPNVPFEHSRRSALVVGELAASQARDVFVELRERMARSNPLQFFLLIDAMQRLMRLRGVESHGYDPLQELVGGILTSLDPDAVMAGRDRTISEGEFSRMELLVRQLAALGAQARIADYIREPDDRNIDARYLLAAEEQFDRTAGYEEILRTIADDVLTQLDDLAPQIGFCVADIMRAADAHMDDQVTRLMAARENGRGTESANVDWSESYRFLHAIASATGRDPVPSIAQTLGLAPAAVRSLLGGLATRLGSQQVSGLTSHNRLRQFPVIQLDDDSFVWATPQDCLHEILEWAELYLAERGLDSARRRLSRARASTTERLTASALAGVFGEERVLRNLEYCDPGGDWVETDVLVDLHADAAIVVEAKSQRITPQGRHASAGRVRTKIEEFLVRPLMQTDRARQTLQEGCDVRCRDSDIARLGPASVRRLIVNLDRVDPFVSHAHRLVGTAEARTEPLATDAWIVSLADFLAVAHLLPSAVELWAYLGKRAAQTASGSPLIHAESDALGAWMTSREGAWAEREGHVFQLSFSSETINAYFNARDLHRRRHEGSEPSVPRPSAGIPPQVLDTMNALIDTPGWPYAADAIADVTPRDWSRFDRDMRRVRIVARTRQQRRARAAAERGSTFVSVAPVTIRPGHEPRLEVLIDGEHLVRHSTALAKIDPMAVKKIHLTVPLLSRDAQAGMA